VYSFCVTEEPEAAAADPQPPPARQARDERENPRRSAEPAKTPAALAHAEHRGAMTIATGRACPVRPQTSTAIMAAAAPARKFPAATIDSRLATVVTPTTRR